MTVKFLTAITDFDYIMFNAGVKTLLCRRSVCADNTLLYKGNNMATGTVKWFNGGKGYANTIYSHCNFLAGKKINLLAKILKAIEDVQELYNQIRAKRAEYYEYNQ